MAKKLDSWDKEVTEIRKKVKSIQGTLSRDEQLKMLFDFPKTKDFVKPTFHKEDYQEYLQEIEKMDAILKIKAAQEKKVKLSRLQMEEESKRILLALPHSKTSNAIKINCQEFINLLTDSERNTVGDKEEWKENLSEEKGKGKRKENGDHSSGSKFIVRNIKLAKCGRGALSLTKEEEVRIQNLLKDVEEEKNANEDEEGSKVGKSEELYAVDEETQSRLSSIDKRLQEFTEGKKLEASESKCSVLSKTKNNEDDGGESIRTEEESSKQKKKKKSSRLREINNLLKYFNSETTEEIDPLPQEQIDCLIEEGKLLFGESMENNEEDKSVSEIVNFSTETVSELVASAKTLMPKFKYRFNEG